MINFGAGTLKGTHWNGHMVLGRFGAGTLGSPQMESLKISTSQAKQM